MCLISNDSDSEYSTAARVRSHKPRSRSSRVQRPSARRVVHESSPYRDVSSIQPMLRPTPPQTLKVYAERRSNMFDPESLTPSADRSSLIPRRQSRARTVADTPTPKPSISKIETNQPPKRAPASPRRVRDSDSAQYIEVDYYSTSPSSSSSDSVEASNSRPKKETRKLYRSPSSTAITTTTSGEHTGRPKGEHVDRSAVGSSPGNRKENDAVVFPRTIIRRRYPYQ